MPRISWAEHRPNEIITVNHGTGERRYAYFLTDDHFLQATPSRAPGVTFEFAARSTGSTGSIPVGQAERLFDPTDPLREDLAAYRVHWHDGTEASYSTLWAAFAYLATQILDFPPTST